MLGGFEVIVNGTATTARNWTRRPAAALVKILAMVPGHHLHREQLMDMMWPDVDPRHAAPKLHKAAHFARRATGRQDAIVLLNDTVQLFPGAHLSIDVVTFEELARLAIADSDADTARAAVAHYGGELLPADLYEDWAAERRELLRRRHLELLRLAGRWVELSELDPVDEHAHVQLMQHFADTGDCTSALRQFEHMERILDRDLGVQPGPQARELRDRLADCGGGATGAATSSRSRPETVFVPSNDVNLAGSVEAVLTELAELTQRQAALLDALATAGILPAPHAAGAAA